VEPTCTVLRQSRLPKCFGWWQPHRTGPLRSRRHLCCAACAGWLTVPVRQHQREVCSLSCGVMLPVAQPLSAPLQRGLRFLPPLLPAVPSAHLAVRFPG
jgi:hypothetical protein